MKIVNLSSFTVEIIDSITWGMQEQIKCAMLGDTKISGQNIRESEEFNINIGSLLAAKYKTIELCVKKITTDDGSEISYTKEWMDNLSVEDGDTLYNAINEVTKPTKK